MLVEDTLEVGDAFGAALRDWYENRAPRAHVIERDDGFIDVVDTAQYFAPPEHWPEIERWALDGVAGRVLDVGAGAGRHALFLQEQGREVVALEVAPVAAEVCRTRGVRQVFAGTVEDFMATSPAQFDAFVLLGNNLGLMRDADYARRFLDLLASLANPVALIAGTCLDPYRSLDPAHLRYHERNRAAGRMDGQVRMRVRYREQASPWWEWLFLSLDELEGLLHTSRWCIEDVRDSDPTYAVRMRLK